MSIELAYPDPDTTDEWQKAADLAYGASVLQAARNYGLVTGGPVVNQARCDFILSEARKRGIHPHPDAAKRFALAHMVVEEKS